MDACTELDVETYREGYLQRKKGVTKSVKKRYFCLNHDAFITFKSEDDAKRNDECLDVLPLIDVQTVKKQHTNNHKHYPFEIITLQKTHVFLTDSAYEQDQWVKAFHNAMKLRSFNQQKGEVTSKYANGKDRRSSTGARKLSQIKKYMQDNIRSGQQRKSSGVDCELGETPDYQGISIGTNDVGIDHDDVFETSKPTSATSKSPETAESVVEKDEADGDVGNGSKSRASDDSGQGSHDVRKMNSTSSANTASSDGDAESGAAKSFAEGTHVTNENGKDASITSSLTPPPVPAPASSGLSRSKKRVFEDEQIYDEPPRIDEDIYDVPPREDEDGDENEIDADEEEDKNHKENDQEHHSTGLIKSSAMSDLQKILDQDTDEDDENDVNDNDVESEYDNVNGSKERDSLEAALTDKGVEKSAVEQLKDLLDSFDEL